LNVLLVEPQKTKSWGKNNQHTGLLKIANWQKSIGNNVQYVVSPALPAFYPDEIYFTSMFTYDYKNVWNAIKLYRAQYPKAKTLLGGIYASLCPEHATKSGVDEVFVGQHPVAKNYPPDPTVLNYSQDFAYIFTSYG